MKLSVDLRAPTISQNQRVWRLFPGSGYQFLDTFVEEGVGFLDFPGLDLPKGKIADAKDLIPRIVRSQRIIEALRAGVAEPEKQLTLETFHDAKSTQNRGRLRLL